MLVGYIYNEQLNKVVMTASVSEQIEPFKNKSLLLVNIKPVSWSDDCEVHTYCFPITRGSKRHIFYYDELVSKRKENKHEYSYHELQR